MDKYTWKKKKNTESSVFPSVNETDLEKEYTEETGDKVLIAVNYHDSYFSAAYVEWLEQMVIELRKKVK